MKEDYMPLPVAAYQRRPQDSDYYHCVEDYFETFATETATPVIAGPKSLHFISYHH
jgi:hypothetical protein